MKKPFIIGICGGSGSGKSYFLHRLLELLDPTKVCLFAQDNYYRGRESQSVDINGVSNFDVPNAIDHQQYAADLLALSQGKTVEKLEYTFNNDQMKPKMLIFEPKPIIIVEGIFVFHYPLIADQLDFKIFIDAKDYIRLKRRIIRDNKERGYGLDDVLYRYDNHVIPAYEKYIKPYKDTSDMIIPNNKEHSFDKILVLVSTFLQSKTQ
ncbi:MAG: uridine kinase [Bacteroidetes bacterium]|nr:MAG: uridine kinase [Bacteroidota bacterium]